MTPENEMLPFFVDLKDLLEMNCLQSVLADQARNVIGNEYKETYTEAKIDASNSCRREMFNIYLASRKEVDVNFEKEFRMTERKKLLVDQMKIVYGVDGKFEDFFHWFNIKFEPYKKEVDKMYADFENYANNCPSDMSLLHVMYNEYLESLRFFVVKEACKTIAETLYDEFQGSGYKSFYYGVPLNQHVHKVKSDVIEDAAKKAYNLELKCQSLYRDELKKAKKAKDSEKYDSTALMNLEDDLHFSGMLTDYMQVLQNRINESNKVSISTKSKVKLAMSDFLTGVPIAQSTNGRDWIYIHTGEIEYVNYLLEKMKSSVAYNKVFGDKDVQIEPEK